MRFILVFLFSALQVFAHNNDSLRTYHLISPEKKVLDAVAEEFEIVARIANGYVVYVHEGKLARFKALAPAAQFQPVPKERLNFAGYRTYQQVEAELKELAIKFPELAKLETYGTTASGHTLYALKVSDNVSTDETEPELMITSATHGDEVITVEVEMELIHELLNGYGKNERLTRMINEKELYFIPMVNPQGYSRRDRYAAMTDPNRDYPYPGQEDRASVDCIDSIRKFFHTRDFKGSMDLHAYGKLIMYPWAYTRNSPPAEDETNFQYLTNAMAEMNKYEAGQISKIIYVAKGSSADYYYWKNKTLALGIELATSKAPAFSQVPKVVDEAREMIWRFIEHF